MSLRNFCYLLEDSLVVVLFKDGWGYVNVKYYNSLLFFVGYSLSNY